MEGLVGVADPIKATTHEAIETLPCEGIKVVMLTGDNRTTAEAVAKSVGIDHIEADVLPDQKAAVVKRLQASGERVAMESAGVTLVKADLRPSPLGSSTRSSGCCSA